MDLRQKGNFGRIVGIAVWGLTVGSLGSPAAGLASGSGTTSTPPIAPTAASSADPAVHAAYDPMDLGNLPAAVGIDLTVHDPARSRDIPIRIYLPSAPKPTPPAPQPSVLPAPVILFSPGLGGNREGYRYLAEHWSSRGYVVVVLQHPGSDDAVWRDVPRRKLRSTLKEAMSVNNFILRARDVAAVLDQLGTWNQSSGDPLFGRLDLKQVGMAGHSYGAITTEAVSGETFSSRGPVLTDQRIRAALAMSPSAPKHEDAATAFASVRIPWMLMTGTEDISPIGEYDAASRLTVYPHLNHAAKYQLVLDRAEHSAFSDRELPTDRHARDPRHHRIILALSTAFWDETLRSDPAAARWLNGSGPRSVLVPADRWEFAVGPAMKPVKP
jgi:predicted dienelactone hydrolase